LSYLVRVWKLIC